MGLNGNSSDSDSSRRELYDRFLADIARDRRVMFYDLDDLVELYDYANDVQDRYVAMEVLFCGERLYPDSVELAERRALFYFGYDEDAAAHAVEALPESSMIGILLSLRLKHASADVSSVAFERLLAERTEFTDEEIIQLSDAAEELGMFDWLTSHREAICSHTDYPQTFLYELTQIAMERNPELAIKLLEELTMLEPFTTDFWLTTAQIYVGYLSSPDKALNALEYALAIEPDNVRGLMLKAQCFNDLNYPVEQIEPVLREVMQINPGVSAAPMALALLYANDNRREEAKSIILDLFAVFGPDPQMLDVLLTVSDGDVDTAVVDGFLTAELKDYVDNFVDMAERHAGDGRHGAAAALLLSLDRVYGIESDRDLMMEELYRAGRYQDAVDRFEALDTVEPFRRSAEVSVGGRIQFFIYILSLLRLGVRNADMQMFVAELIKNSMLDVSHDSADDLMRSRSLIKLLIKLHAYLSSIDSLDMDEIDPFVRGLS